MFTFLRKMSVGTTVGTSYLGPTLNRVNARMPFRKVEKIGLALKSIELK